MFDQLRHTELPTATCLHLVRACRHLHIGAPRFRCHFAFRVDEPRLFQETICGVRSVRKNLRLAIKLGVLWRAGRILISRSGSDGETPVRKFTVFDSVAHFNGGGGPCFAGALVSSRVRGAGVLTTSRDLRHGTAPTVDLYRDLRAGDSGVKSPNVLLAQFSKGRWRARRWPG